MRRGERSVFPTEGDFLLRAQILNAGVGMARDAAYCWHGLKRGQSEFCIFQLTLSGAGELVYRGEVLSVPPGSAMLLRVPEDHEYRYPAGSKCPWKFLFLSVRGSEVMRLWSLAVRAAGPIIALAENSPLLEAAARSCRYVLQTQELDPGRASVLAYEMGVRVLAEAKGTAGGWSSPAAGRPHSAAIAAAVRFCADHLADPIGVEEMAAAAGLSRYHFSREFRRMEQTSPGRFLLWQRLRRAAELLCKTELPIAEVARRSGFADVSYFGRAFARHYSLTPLAFRKSGVY
jgi:AraC family transcriptional regulator